MNSPHRNLPRRMELPLRYTLSGSLSGKHVCTGEARCGDSVATAAGDAGRLAGAAARRASGVCVDAVIGTEEERLCMGAGGAGGAAAQGRENPNQAAGMR